MIVQSIPFRHHEFHFLNAGIVFNTIVTLVFPFLGQAIKDTVRTAYCLLTLIDEVRMFLMY